MNSLQSLGVLDLLDIVGQSDAVSRLQRLMASARMPHAFIFAGPAGVGKQTTAAALAKTLLCNQPRITPAGQLSAEQRANLGPVADDQPIRQACNSCQNCRTMDAGTNSDFNLVYKELARYHEQREVRDRVMQELGIPVIRQFLIDPAHTHSVHGRGKVFVLLEAELMNDEAQNALLKTLEEPPPGVTIILITEQPELLLATTLSRCAFFNFHLLPRQFVLDQLKSAGIADNEAAFWANFTGGSLGKALELSRQEMYNTKREMLLRLAEPSRGGESLGDFLGKANDALIGQLVAEAKKEDNVEMSKTLASRRAAGIMLELIASAYRDALQAACVRQEQESSDTGGGDVGRPYVHSDQMDVVEALSQRFQPTQLAEIIEQISQFEQLLWRNVNPKIVWDNVVITCTSAAPLWL